MPLEDFSFFLDQIVPFQGIFHLHGFGEPLLDRNLVQKIQELKRRCPSSMAVIFSSLGVRMAEDYFAKLLDAGLDLMFISLYGFTVGDYEKIHGYNGFELVKRNLQFLSDSMKRFQKFSAIIKIPSLAISSALPIASSQAKKDFCGWVEKLGFDIREWNYVHNYSSGRHYNAPNAKRICPVIRGKRRKILNLTWDLNVVPCCYDFNATISFGNLHKQSLKEIFSGAAYLDFVIAHQTGSLSAYPVCQNCEKFDYQ
jgi:MoaA/NifB/PqqE/SkfB family radical SAM enzyme